MSRRKQASSSPSRQHSNTSLSLNITPSNELCWERQLGGTAMSRTFRVRCPVSGLVAIKLINIQLIADIRGLPPSQVWKETMAEIALVNSLAPKCPHILSFHRLTTNVRFCSPRLFARHEWARWALLPLHTRVCVCVCVCEDCHRDGSVLCF